jgi:hypothetical protein
VGTFTTFDEWSHAVWSMTPQNLNLLISKEQKQLAESTGPKPTPDQVAAVEAAKKQREDREVEKNKLETLRASAERAIAGNIGFKGDLKTAEFQKAKLEAFKKNPPAPKTDIVNLDTAVNAVFGYVMDEVKRRSEPQQVIFLGRLVAKLTEEQKSIQSAGDTHGFAGHSDPEKKHPVSHCGLELGYSGFAQQGQQPTCEKCLAAMQQTKAAAAGSEK